MRITAKRVEVHEGDRFQLPDGDIAIMVEGPKFKGGPAVFVKLKNKKHPIKLPLEKVTPMVGLPSTEYGLPYNGKVYRYKFVADIVGRFYYLKEFWKAVFVSIKQKFNGRSSTAK